MPVPYKGMWAKCPRNLRDRRSPLQWDGDSAACGKVMDSRLRGNDKRGAGMTMVLLFISFSSNLS